MGYRAGLKPRFELVDKGDINEGFAPQRTVFHACLGQRAIEIEQADQAWPLPRPVCDREDGTLVRHQPGQHMMRVLPNGFGHDERCVGVDGFEDFDALSLRPEEAVASGWIKSMAADDLVAEIGDSSGELLFHLLLGFPTDAVGGVAKIA